MRRATLPGRVVPLEPASPLLIVTDLQGDCAHAAAFGALEQPTEEMWTLIEALLDTAGGGDLGPIDARTATLPVSGCGKPFAQ